MALWYFSMLFDTYHFQFWQFDMTVKQYNISVHYIRCIRLSVFFTFECWEVILTTKEIFIGSLQV